MFALLVVLVPVSASASDYVPFLPDTTSFAPPFDGQAFHFVSPGQCLEVSAGNLDDEIAFDNQYIPSVIMAHIFGRIITVWNDLGGPTLSTPGLYVSGVVAGWSYPNSLTVTFAVIDSTSENAYFYPYTETFEDNIPEFGDSDPTDTTSVQQINLFIQFGPGEGPTKTMQTVGSLGTSAETTTDPTSRPWGTSVIDIFDVAEKTMSVPTHLLYRITNTGTGGSVAYDISNTSLVAVAEVPSLLPQASAQIDAQWQELALSIKDNYNDILASYPGKTPCGDRGGLRVFIHEDGASCANGVQDCVIYGDGSTLGLPVGGGTGGAPTANAGPDQTVECAGTSGTAVMLDGTGSSDPSSLPLTFTWTATGITFDDPHSSTPTGEFPVGTTTVTLTVSNGTDEASDTVDITVTDTTSPSITVSVSRNMLWPANHKMVAITANVQVSDACDGSVSWSLTSITSDEPDNGLGDGDQPNDIQDAVFGTNDSAFLLRSERQGSGDGRVYTIVYTAQDDAGNTATASVQVLVPRDQSGKANSFAGFNALGTDFDPNVAGYSIVIPADVSFDPQQVDLSTVDVGNTVGIIGAIETSMADATGDGLMDLVVRYLVAPTRQLIAEDQGLTAEPVGMHWATQDGSTYWVSDIFGLGAPLRGATTGVDPSVTALYRVRPNPATESSRFEYAVTNPTGSRVEAGVFNIAGQRVRVLLNAFQTAGSHEVAWDGRNDHGVLVPGGVYFYRVQIGGETVVRQMILAR